VPRIGIAPLGSDKPVIPSRGSKSHCEKAGRRPGDYSVWLTQVKCGTNSRCMMHRSAVVSLAGTQELENPTIQILSL